MKVLRRSKFVMVVKFVMTTSSLGIIIRDKNNVKIRSFPAKFNLANAKAARVMTTSIMAVVAAVMLLGSQEPGRMGDWMLALTIAWVATAIILFSATYLQKWLGTRVLTAIERLMGMVIVAISVQMLLDGLSAYLGQGG